MLVRSQAERFRDENGLNLTEPVSLTSLLQRLGVLTIFKSLTENISGISLKKDNLKFMMVNSDDTLGRQNFTICHELYHLFIQEDFVTMVCYTGVFNKSDKIEYQADLFASHLLIPEVGLIEIIPKEETKKNKITLPTIIKIEQLYNCSRSALLFRLKRMGLIDGHLYDIFCNNVKPSAIKLGYGTQLYSVPPLRQNLNNEYGVKAQNLFKNHVISESHYISLMNDLGISTDELLDFSHADSNTTQN